jgi:hypothetical protein
VVTMVPRICVAAAALVGKDCLAMETKIRRQMECVSNGERAGVPGQVLGTNYSS